MTHKKHQDETEMVRLNSESVPESEARMSIFGELLSNHMEVAHANGYLGTA